VNAEFFSTSNLTRLFLRICLIALALVVVAEIILWSFFRAPVNPMLTMRMKNKIPGLKEVVTLHINGDQQLRSINWTAGPREPGTLRILCIGGSATVGQLQNAQDTWWGQLAVLIQEKMPGTKIEVGANAAGGMHALPTVKWATSFLDDWKPDIIISNLGASDVMTQPLQYKYDASAFSLLPSANRERSAIKQMLLKVSQLAKWSRVRNARSDAAHIEYQIGSQDYFTDSFARARKELAKLPPIPNPFRLSDADPRNEYLDALKQLLDHAKGAGATLMLTGEPNLCHESMDEASEALRCTFMPKSAGEGNMVVRVDSAWVEREIRRYQEVAEKLAADNQLTFLDLNGEVPQNPAHFVTETIVTDEGARVMANLLLPKVLPIAQKLTSK